MSEIFGLLLMYLAAILYGAKIDEVTLKKTYTLGYLTGSKRRHWDFEYPRPGLTISGAISLALSELNAPPIPGETEGGMLARRGIHLEIQVAETYGEEMTSILNTAALWAANVSAFIGPQETCVHEAKMAAAFNLPMISYYCTDHATSDKRLFPTFARTRPPDTHISKSVVALLRAFNWTSVALLHLAAPDTQYSRVADTLLLAMQTAGVRVSAKLSWPKPYHHGYMENPFPRLLRDTLLDTRIYVIVGYYYETLGLLSAMQELGLFQQGEYFVVGVDVEKYDPEKPEKYLRDLLRYEKDPNIQQAFRNFVGVVASSPPAQLADNFTQLVNFYMEQPPFSFPNPLTFIGGVKKLRPEAAYLYDAVKLYASALCDVLDSGGDPLNGTAIIKCLLGRNYVSAMGYVTRMDENGDAEGNYTLLSRRTHHRTPGDFGLYPSGNFLLGTKGELELHITSDIEWPRGAPPMAEPECGFRKEKCITHTTEIIAGIAGCIFLVVLLVCLVLYRNWAYEQELDSLLWKLDYKDIQLQTTEDVTYSAGLTVVQNTTSPNGNAMTALGAKQARPSTHPLVRTSQVSLSSNPEADFRYSALYTTVGFYRGRLFAVKRVNRKHIDITRSMKKELKMLRDLRHDNLNAFIGACTDPPNICIVTEYCARGSLKDIIENEDLKLDNMFVASLIGDIVRGMTFLHDSPVHSHGNLKASNCLVDSRWVLKIADFGLHEIKQDPSIPAWTKYKNPDGQWCGNDLTYRAPELLRQMNQQANGELSHWTADDVSSVIINEGLAASLVGRDAMSLAKEKKYERVDDSLMRGTQEGDVYSFGIILYEVHTRHPAYESTGLSIHRIVSNLVVETSPPFRPPLDVLKGGFDFVRELIRDCWAEIPSQRPDFRCVRNRLRPMRKGIKPNIFDNMMAMMEKYANNLEALVDERTDQLVEEKKKTEALLFEMLPRSVAEQLRRGHKVQAESYDSVTIYFSDIVGFTAMSAESTPLQVVNFLNDLYTCFDATIENYDVYKVETIGDAYMVVSGLPIRNGDAHAGEIASMALQVLENVRGFTIRHRPGDALMLRIGIHSGPVCAGVVGLKMPRYCLFGDTVNTASRMESTGLPFRIHCSAECRNLLLRLGGYDLSKRGLVAMKGKGDHITYWLNGEDPILASERRRLRREKLRRGPSVSVPANNGAPSSSPNCQDNNCFHYNCSAPRSSLKKSRSPIFHSLLSRASSLETPKRLRFALGSLEQCDKSERTIDANVLSSNNEANPLLPDKVLQHSPCRPRCPTPAWSPASASCPCIEALHLIAERQPLCWTPSHFSSVANCSVPLLLGTNFDFPPASTMALRTSLSDSNSGDGRDRLLLLLGLARESTVPPPSRD